MQSQGRRQCQKSWSSKFEKENVPWSLDNHVNTESRCNCKVVDNVRKFYARGLKNKKAYLESSDWTSTWTPKVEVWKTYMAVGIVINLLCIKCNARHVWSTHPTKDITDFLNFLICFHLFSVHHLSLANGFISTLFGFKPLPFGTINWGCSSLAANISYIVGANHNKWFCAKKSGNGSGSCQ